MNGILEHLFGKGTLIFKGLPPTYAGIGLVLAIGLLAGAWFIQVGRWRRWALVPAMICRFLAIAIALFVLAEPVLRNEEEIPQQSFLIHLFDTSESMKIADYDRQPRVSAVWKAAVSESSEASQKFKKRYRSLQFAFNEGLKVRDAGDRLESDDKGTDIVSSLRALETQVKGFPVSGIILYSDGNPTLNATRKAILESASRLHAPIYAVGSAPETPGPDFWIEKVIAPKDVAKGIATKVTVLVGARKMKGQTVEVALTTGDTVIERRSLSAATDEQTLNAEFKLQPAAEGITSYHVAIKTVATESYPWNNDEDFFVRCSQNKARILYIEGYPRYEYRFLRAAFEEDERFQVASVVFVNPKGQTYRQGIDKETELTEGFPKTQEELFGYDVVVIGDVPSSTFSAGQMKSLSEFVSKRGGGLLFLAGDNSFDPKGFGATPLADVLPFEFSPDPKLRQEFRVIPTAEGMQRSILGLADKTGGKGAPWDLLPPLKGLFPLMKLKPGASALCRIEMGRNDLNPPVVAYQRYGRGTTLVCGISGTWPWRFQTESNNTSYQAFWKEMSLILLQGAQNRITVEAYPPIVALGGDSVIQGSVFDKEYKLCPGAKVTLEIEAPDGAKTPLATGPAKEKSMTYQQTLKTSKPGIYRIRATTQLPGETEQFGAEAVCMVKEERAELKEIRLNEPLLREIATSTGGEYAHLSKYDTLLDRIHPRQGAACKVNEKPIWDKSGFLIAVLGLALAEWFLRRLGGLA